MAHCKCLLFYHGSLIKHKTVLSIYIQTQDKNAQLDIQLCSLTAVASCYFLVCKPLYIHKEYNNYFVWEFKWFQPETDILIWHIIQLPINMNVRRKAKYRDLTYTLCFLSCTSINQNLEGKKKIDGSTKKGRISARPHLAALNGKTYEHVQWSWSLILLSKFHFIPLSLPPKEGFYVGDNMILQYKPSSDFKQVNLSKLFKGANYINFPQQRNTYFISISH